MNLSRLFIHRPVATTLLTVAIALAGAIAFNVLPVSPLPQVDYPTISVGAALPGASAEIMAASVATPLERQFGHIAGVTEMTSTSSLGTTAITLQFDLSRNIDGAARDVEAAINAARTYLPANLPANPTYRKVNPADSPIMVIGLTSDIYDRGKLYDEASTIVQQKLSQIQGVGQVTTGGGALPSVRVDVNPTQLNSYGLTLASIQSMLSLQNAHQARGQLSDGIVNRRHHHQRPDPHADDYKPLIVGYNNGAAVRLSDVADVTDSVQNIRSAGYLNGKPAIPDHHLPPARRQHHPDGGKHPPRAAFDQGLDPDGHRNHHRSRPHHHHPRLGEGRRAHADHLDLPGGGGGVSLPAQSARHADSRGGRAGFADRHLRGDVPVRLQHRQSLADGAHHLHRLRGGRRDCGDGKHHAPHRERHGALRRRAAGAQRRSASPSSRSASR